MRQSRTTNVSTPKSTRAPADCALQCSKACSPLYCFERKSKTSTWKLMRQSFRRIANGITPLQNAVFAEQDHILCIVVFQIAVDVTSLAPLSCNGPESSKVRRAVLCTPFNGRQRSAVPTNAASQPYQLIDKNLTTRGCPAYGSLHETRESDD